MISASKGTKIVKKLVKKDLVKVHQINLGGRGGSAKFLELTEKGYAAIGMKPKPGIGRGAGFEHGFWQHQIREHLRNVEEIQKADIEGMLSTKCIDVLVETKELGMIAIEIAMTSDHEKVNIEKDIEAGAAKVFVACRDKSVLENVAKVLKELSEDTRSKVSLCLVHQLVGEVEAFLKISRSNGLT
jgi:DNA-binding MarR family transcriptional regulator